MANERLSMRKTREVLRLKLPRNRVTRSYCSMRVPLDFRQSPLAFPLNYLADEDHLSCPRSSVEQA
jgi:hypothetical protein